MEVIDSLSLICFLVGELAGNAATSTSVSLEEMVSVVGFFFFLPPSLNFFNREDDLEVLGAAMLPLKLEEESE